MPDILLYIVKVSISHAAIYLLYTLLLSRLTFYQWNRWYLLGYAVICFFLPLMNIYGWMEDHTTGQLLQLVPAMHSWTDNAQLVASQQWTMFDTILLVFKSGVGVMLGRIVIQLISLHRMHKRARLLTNEGIKLYEVSHPIIPFSFGMKVFIHPQQHDESELKEIIRHEMVHVREHHTVDIVFAEILVALNWFNPFSWLLRYAIRQNLEFIADRKVLENGLDRKQYQHLLLKVIGQQQFSIASHLNFSALKKRITMMNKIKSAKVHLIKFLFVLPLITFLLLAFRHNQESGNLVPEQLDPAISEKDTLPEPKTDRKQVPLNQKGYYITIADNNGECIVIIKDKSKTLVKAVLLSDWNKDSNKWEAQYGEIPPPPPPPPPAISMAPLSPEFSAEPVEPAEPVDGVEPLAPISKEPIKPAKPAPQASPLPPKPPKAPKTAANIRSVSIVNHSATITLKNGKTEKYNLDNTKEKAAFEQKYGTQIREVIVPEVSPSPQPVPSVDIKVDAVANVNANANVVVSQNINHVVELSENQPLYFIDGKEASKAEVNTLKPEEIAEMQVLKNKEAIDKYGQKGKNGVIKITLKKNKKISLFNPFASFSSEKDNC